MAALSPLIAIPALTASVGLASAVVASIFVSLPEGLRRSLVPHLVSFATGALLGAALLGLIPEAIEGVGPSHVRAIGVAIVAGLLFFFLLEKLVLWRHCHDANPCEGHPLHGSEGHRHGSSSESGPAVGPMLLLGEAFHNALDGVIVAAAYLTRPELGVATALAVFAHELPQEMGNIAVLLHSGVHRWRALALNLLSSLGAVLGGVAALYAFETVSRLLPYGLAVAGASLLYVAVADLIPGLHRHVTPRRSLEQIVLIVAGLAVIWFTQHAEGAHFG
jgi:zinc and cadmium transporter